MIALMIDLLYKTTSPFCRFIASLLMSKNKNPAKQSVTLICSLIFSTMDMLTAQPFLVGLTQLT